MLFAKLTSMFAIALAVVLGAPAQFSRRTPRVSLCCTHSLARRAGHIPQHVWFRDAAGNLYGTTYTGGITGGVCTVAIVASLVGDCG